MQTEQACTPVNRARSGGFYDTPPPKRKQCESMLKQASLNPEVDSQDRSNQGDLGELEKSVSEKKIAAAEAAMRLWSEETEQKHVVLELSGVQCGDYLGRGR